MNRARNPIVVVPKGWGREVWIVNGDLYCGKILEISKAKRCSLHFHKLKTRLDARSAALTRARPVLPPSRLALVDGSTVRQRCVRAG